VVGCVVDVVGNGQVFWGRKNRTPFLEFFCGVAVRADGDCNCNCNGNGNGNSKDEIQGSFAALRMTA
jgi:hypothetical protein